MCRTIVRLSVAAALLMLAGCEGQRLGQSAAVQSAPRQPHAEHAAQAAQAAVAGPSVRAQTDLTLSGAHRVLTAAMNRAAELDLRMNIAVVDAGGNLKGFVRMDGAWLGSIDIAVRKARTARHFDMPTGEIGKLSQPGGPLYNIEHSNDGLITFPGGLPLRDRAGQVVGAVGVSGSTVEHDHDVASAGAAALNE